MALAVAARFGRGFCLMSSARAVLGGPPAVRRHDVKECQRSVFGRPCRPSKPDGARQKHDEEPPRRRNESPQSPLRCKFTQPGLQFDTKLPAAGAEGGELGTEDRGRRTPDAKGHNYEAYNDCDDAPDADRVASVATARL